MVEYPPEYVYHCFRYAPEIAKLDVRWLPETFVALECNVGPWAAFCYYGLIEESHYTLLAGNRASKEHVIEHAKKFEQIGYPTLSRSGKFKFKARRKAILEILGAGGKRYANGQEQRTRAFLQLSQHIVQFSRADVELRKRWHQNVYEHSLRNIAARTGERLSQEELRWRNNLFVCGVNAGDGPDGIAAGVLGGRCIGVACPDGHRPCILCAYPLPFKIVDSGPKYNWYGAYEGRGYGRTPKPRRSRRRFLINDAVQL